MLIQHEGYRLIRYIIIFCEVGGLPGEIIPVRIEICEITGYKSSAFQTQPQKNIIIMLISKSIYKTYSLVLYLTSNQGWNIGVFWPKTKIFQNMLKTSLSIFLLALTHEVTLENTSGSQWKEVIWRTRSSVDLVWDFQNEHAIKLSCNRENIFKLRFNTNKTQKQTWPPKDIKTGFLLQNVWGNDENDWWTIWNWTED